MKDFLGQEYAEGDFILYAAMSGRSCNMVLGYVLKFNESGSVKVQPVKSARWTQHGRTRYIDTRTGKGVDPHRSPKHILKDAHFTDKVTGVEVSYAEMYAYLDEHYGKGYRNFYHDYLDYVPVQYQPWIEVQKDVIEPVTLTITDNIVRWTGMPQ